MPALPETHPTPYAILGRSGIHATPVLAMRDKPLLINLGLGHVNFFPWANLVDQAVTTPTVVAKCKIVSPGVFQITGYNKDGTSSLMTYGELVSTADVTFNVAAVLPLTTVFVVDAGPAQNKVWSGTAGSVLGVGGTFAALNGTTLVVKVGSSAPVTVTFTVAETDAPSTAAKIAATVPGTACNVSGGQVRISSTIIGSSPNSRIEIIFGNAAAGFTTGSVGQGTGDAADMAAMTRQEFIAAVSGITGLRAYETANTVHISSTTLGQTGSIKINSGEAPFGFTAGVTTSGSGVETLVQGFAFEANPASLSI